MDIDTLQKTNSSLKTSIQANIIQFQFLLTELQTINSNNPAKKREYIQTYVQVIKNHNMISKQFPKINKLIEDIGSELIGLQVRKNVSDEFRKVIKLLETKITELRSQIQVKQINFIQAKQSKIQPLSFSDQYFVPKYYQFRKLHIEHLHKQKIDKLLKALGPLRQKNNNTSATKQQSDFLQTDCKGTIEKLRSFQIQIVEGMRTEIQKQEKRGKELSQKHEVYRKIYELVCEENTRVKKELIKNKQS